MRLQDSEAESPQTLTPARVVDVNNWSAIHGCIMQHRPHLVERCQLMNTVAVAVEVHERPIKGSLLVVVL